MRDSAPSNLSWSSPNCRQGNRRLLLQAARQRMCVTDRGCLPLADVDVGRGGVTLAGRLRINRGIFRQRRPTHHQLAA
jgi:hypothetical protein